ncbi:hypothetical protein AB0B45_31775 [Nonomuraea sp. NPDC049152]|uniref:hypothetical protein n=1 Tax=Nonomuraea sp. NPDC049152 TaxID=3154350 RepID=UPI0033FAF881
MWGILHAAGIDPVLRWAGPSWRQFLTAQAHTIITCDFLVVETVLLKRRLTLEATAVSFIQPPPDRFGLP